MTFSRTVPALPVREMAAAVSFYADRLGFTAVHEEESFAVVVRDAAELHLWSADDDGWRLRSDLAAGPVVSGAESFLAGTASCRIEVDDVDLLHGELSGVLHPTDPGSPVDTAWGTREIAALDLDGNLLTLFQRRASASPSGR